MPIPDHVLRQALDAVSHHETTAKIRAFKDSGIEASPGFTPAAEITPQLGYRPLTEDIMRQATDAVSHHETMASVRLVESIGSISPGHTPSHQSRKIAEKVAEMHKTGQDVGAIQRAITKDNFGREHEIG